MDGLTLEIELLTGAYRAALPDGSTAEWPPHPERIFSALAQAWADGDKRGEERDALLWLEALEPPAIEAEVSVSMRTSPDVFVPPNDFEIPAPSKPFSWPIDKETGSPRPVGHIPWSGIEPTIRSTNFRQARSFQVAVPASPVVRMIWSTPAPFDIAASLRALASRVSSLGHSASLARMAFVERAIETERLWEPAADGEVALRVPYKNRLADLERWYEAGERPRSPATHRYRLPGRPVKTALTASIFGSDWLVFEGIGGFQPEVLGFAHVAKRVRDALMQASPIQPAPEIISGHAADGMPSQNVHLAVVPLLDVGWPFSRGDLLGLALVLPRKIAGTERSVVLRAIAEFARLAPDEEFRATLQLTRERSWHLQRSAAASRASLRPARWCGVSYLWMSATPVVLDRFPADDDPIEAAQIIARSCVNVDLPEPIEIQIHKYSGLSGAPSAYPSGRTQALPDWSFPRDSKLRDRPRRHVVIRFAERVRGPVLLGAGRYQGLGLCLPVEEAHL